MTVSFFLSLIFLLNCCVRFFSRALLCRSLDCFHLRLVFLCSAISNFFSIIIPLVLLEISGLFFRVDCYMSVILFSTSSSSCSLFLTDTLGFVLSSSVCLKFPSSVRLLTIRYISYYK